MAHSHCFSSSENVSISPSFQKDNFTEYRIYSWQSFPFSTWKMLCHFLLASMVFGGSHVIQIIFLIGKVLFLFHCLHFFVCSVFRSLIMFLGVDLFEFIFFEIHLASWICKFIHFHRFENFSFILSANIPSAFFSSGTLVTQMWDFPCRSLRCCALFSAYFFSL